MSKPLLSKHSWDADRIPKRNPAPQPGAGHVEGGKAFVASACCHRLAVGLHCVFPDLAEFLFSRAR